MAMGLLAKLLPSPEELAKLINPDEIAAMMKAAGIDPARIMVEVDGFKLGVQQAMLHFNGRFTALEKQNTEIVALLRELTDKQPRAITDNCVQMDVRETKDG